MHNDLYPLLHSLNTELFDIKLDLTKLSSPADNSTQLLLIKFRRLSRIIQALCMKCKTLQRDKARRHGYCFIKGKTRTHSASDVKHLKPGLVTKRVIAPAGLKHRLYLKKRT